MPEMDLLELNPTIEKEADSKEVALMSLDETEPIALQLQSVQQERHSPKLQQSTRKANFTSTLITFQLCFCAEHKDQQSCPKQAQKTHQVTQSG